MRLGEGCDTRSAVVIGAGPAGLTAAVTLAESEVPVVLIDAGPRPGGQYWRYAGDSEDHHDPIFQRLHRRLDGLRRSGMIDYRPGREVWLITGQEAGRRVELRPTAGIGPAERESVIAERLVLCPGGHDRQLPIPGWDLPGVLAAGGAQSLLKGQHTPAGRRVIVAGTGPFLLPVATGLARAGATVTGICEANAPGRWARSAGAVAAVPSKIIEGAGYAAGLARHRIPYRTRTIIGEIRGDDRVRSVRLDRLDRSGQVTRTGIAEIEVDTVALGWGFTPSLELIMMVGAATRLGADGSLIAAVDEGQRASEPGVYVAGEACGVGGAALARAEGELAARTLLADRERPDNLDRTDNRREKGRTGRRVRRLRAFAAAMHRAHPVPAGWRDWCAPDTLVCRCEEVTLTEVERAGTDLAATSARQLKLLTRCGMGWCQGRICGPSVAALAARLDGRELAEDDLRSMAKRTLAVPVPLGELAQLQFKR